MINIRHEIEQGKTNQEIADMMELTRTQFRKMKKQDGLNGINHNRGKKEFVNVK
jgi:hypothetical protein